MSNQSIRGGKSIKTTIVLGSGLAAVRNYGLQEKISL